MFKVGDRVVLQTPGIGNVLAGDVVRTSPKQVLVNFGPVKYFFLPNGEIKGNCWSGGKIAPITPQIERELLEEGIINKCRRLLEDRISYKQAVQIINVLEDKDEF